MSTEKVNTDMDGQFSSEFYHMEEVADGTAFLFDTKSKNKQEKKLM